MKKYLYQIYADKWGTGDEDLFDSQAEAVDYGESEWDKLTDKEKNVVDFCFVCEIEISPEELEAYNEGELEYSLDTLWTADIWSAK